MSENELAPAGKAAATANQLGSPREGGIPAPLAPLAPPPPGAPTSGIQRSLAEARSDSAMVAQLMSHWGDTSGGPRSSGSLNSGAGGIGSAFGSMNAMRAGLESPDPTGLLGGAALQAAPGRPGTWGGAIDLAGQFSSPLLRTGGVAGLGLGGGFSNLAGSGPNDRAYQGVSSSAGGVAHLGGSAGALGLGGAADTNLYNGIGGIGYSFAGPGGTGRGFEGNLTPLGAANTQAAVRMGPMGEVSGRADNAYLGRTTVGAESGRLADGSVFGRGHLSQRSGVENLSLSGSNPLGQANTSAGFAGVGTEANARATYNPTTGAAGLDADGFSGARAHDVRMQASSGPLGVGASASDLRYGYGGKGSLNVDPSTGQVVATGQGRGGGFSATDVRTQGQLGNVASFHTSAGEISNDAVVTGARAQLDRNGLDAKVDEVRSPGMRARDMHADYNVAGVGSGRASLDEVSTDNYIKGGRAQLNRDGLGLHADNVDFFTGPGVRLQNGSADVRNNLLGTSAHADFGSIGNNNSINGVDIQVDARNPGLRARVNDASYGDWSGSNINVNAQGPLGAQGNAHLGSFALETATANDVRFDADRTGVHASAKQLGYDQFQMSDLQAHANLGNLAQADASLGRGAYQHFEASGARVGLDGDGLSAHMDRGQYDMVQLNNLKASANLGPLASGSVQLGEGGYNHVAARNVNAGLDTSGLHASLDKGEYRYLYGRNLDTQSSVAGGLLNSHVHADLASVGGVTADHLAYNTNLLNTDLSARNLGAHGFQGQNVEVSQSVGGVGMQARAGQLNVADLQVGSLDAHSRNFGTAGNATVDRARLDALNVQDGHVGLSAGGQELVGAGGSLRVGGGVDHAEAQYNLLRGQASGQFRNLNEGVQLDNAHLNLLGHNVNLPNMGAQVKANGDGAVDLGQGRANGQVSLAGSNVNFAGHQVALGQWAQANAGVDVRQGAANVNLGGSNGVGADMNLSQGDLRVHALGHELNVGQGIRDAGQGIANGASTVAHGASNLWHSVFG